MCRLNSPRSVHTPLPENLEESEIRRTRCRVFLYLHPPLSTWSHVPRLLYVYFNGDDRFALSSAYRRDRSDLCGFGFSNWTQPFVSLTVTLVWRRGCEITNSFYSCHIMCTFSVHQQCWHMNVCVIYMNCVCLYYRGEIAKPTNFSCVCMPTQRRVLWGIYV